MVGEGHPPKLGNAARWRENGRTDQNPRLDLLAPSLHAATVVDQWTTGRTYEQRRSRVHGCRDAGSWSARELELAAFQVAYRGRARQRRGRLQQPSAQYAVQLFLPASSSTEDVLVRLRRI